MGGVELVFGDWKLDGVPVRIGHRSLMFGSLMFGSLRFGSLRANRQ